MKGSDVKKKPVTKEKKHHDHVPSYLKKEVNTTEANEVNDKAHHGK